MYGKWKNVLCTVNGFGVCGWTVHGVLAGMECFSGSCKWSAIVCGMYDRAYVVLCIIHVG